MSNRNIVVIDNYDSFTYNFVHILRALGEQVTVVRNDECSVADIQQYSHILLSPGPGVPKNAGIMPEVIKAYASSKNILGVCLGHQGIGEAFGATLHNLSEVYHGVVTPITHSHNDALLNDIPEQFSVCRYHSWVINPKSLPEEIIVTSTDSEGHIMSIKHRDYNVRGVQFHPESLMTEYGEKLISNWLAL